MRTMRCFRCIVGRVKEESSVFWVEFVYIMVGLMWYQVLWFVPCWICLEEVVIHED